MLIKQEAVIANKIIKFILGIVLFLAILYFIYDNFGMIKNSLTFISEEDEEINGTLVGSSSVSAEPLNVREDYFKKDFQRSLFLISITNLDDVEGNVTITVFCNETGYSVSETKSIRPGDNHLFELQDSSDSCITQHIYIPSIVQRSSKK